MIFLRTLILLLFPLPSFADPIKVLTGRHKNFTRAVLYVDAGAKWSVEPSSSGYLIKLDSSENGFDTTDAFRRITQARIKGFQSTPLGLEIEVACACYANAFEAQPGVLVVDITDATDPAQKQLAAMPARPEKTDVARVSQGTLKPVSYTHLTLPTKRIV